MGKWVQSPATQSGNKYIQYRIVVVDGTNGNDKKTVTAYFQGKKSSSSTEYTQGRGTITLYIDGVKSSKTMSYPDASLRLNPNDTWINMHQFSKEVTSANVTVSGSIDFSSLNADATIGNHTTSGLDNIIPSKVTYTFNYGEGNVSESVTVSYGTTPNVNNYQPETIPEGKFWQGWAGPVSYVYSGQWGIENYKIMTENGKTVDLQYNETKGNNIQSFIPKSKAGYKFLGWIDSEGNRIYDEFGEAFEGIYWDKNKKFIYEGLDDKSLINIYENWKIQNITYVKEQELWKLSTVYIKDGNEWKPAIMYVKTGDNWKQSIVK